MSDKKVYFDDILMLRSKLVDIKIFSVGQMMKEIDFCHFLRVLMLPDFVCIFDLKGSPILSFEEFGDMVFIEMGSFVTH